MSKIAIVGFMYLVSFLVMVNSAVAQPDSLRRGPSPLLISVPLQIGIGAVASTTFILGLGLKESVLGTDTTDPSMLRGLGFLVLF